MTSMIIASARLIGGARGMPNSAWSTLKAYGVITSLVSEPDSANCSISSAFIFIFVIKIGKPFKLRVFLFQLKLKLLITMHKKA